MASKPEALKGDESYDEIAELVGKGGMGENNVVECANWEVQGQEDSESDD